MQLCNPRFTYPMWHARTHLKATGYCTWYINQRQLDEAKDMQTWCMHMHALSVPYIYIFQILLYDICTHIQNRCAYARVFCITEVSGCSKTLLCGNPGFPMKQHVLLVKVWSMWALEAVWGWRRWRQELVDHLGPWSGIEKLERLRDLGDETMRHSQVEACSFCMVVFWQY